MSNRKVLNTKLIISLVLVMLSALMYAQTEVRTAEDLNNVRNNLNGNYIQVADIDLSEYNWTAIGGSRNPFRGIYDGGGYRILNLTVEREGNTDVALFGGLGGGLTVGSGTIKNLGIENANITAGPNSGGLVAQVITGANIENCYVNGDITGTYDIGLLIGYLRTGADIRVSNCYTNGSVTGDYNLGGLVGLAAGGEVTNCYAAAYISGNRSLGGLIGGDNVVATVTASYWDTNASGTGISQGGRGLTTEQMLQRANFERWNFRGTWLIREDETYPFLDWQREPASHNYPSEEGLPSNLVGISGNEELFLRWDAPPAGEWAGYNIYRNGDRYAQVARDVTQYNDRNVANYTQYSYYVTAILNDDRESRPSNTVLVTPHLPFAGGDGSEEEPFQIATAQHLNDVRYNLKSHFIQTADINIGVAPWNQGEGWEPIGYYIDTRTFLAFSGRYNGNGNVINGLTIIAPTENYVGLFGFLSEASIVDLKLENVTILANNFVAAITPMASISTEFIRCSVSGEIEARDTVGGLIGLHDAGQTTIENCHFNGAITGRTIIGGIIAETRTQTTGEIKQSSCEGTISGTTGSVAGIVATNNLSISECKFDGTISGDTNTGGIAGTTSTSITKSSAFGSLTQTGFAGGGIAAKTSGTAAITYCYADMEIVAYRVTGSIVGAHGDNNNLNPIISNCYGRGSVTASDDDMSIMIGGLVGHSYANISNSYSTCRVTGPENDIGGFIERRSAGAVAGCYWDLETSGTERSAGGTGRLTRQMTYPYGDDTYTGWDFDEIWQNDVNAVGNDGYPMLFWQEIPPVLDSPIISAKVVNIDGEDYCRISWDAVEGASSYKVFAANVPNPEDWGEAVDVVEETEYREAISEVGKNRFYRVIASAR